MSYDKQECMSALEESDEVFYAKMQKGLDDARNGRITPLDDVYAELSKAISEIKNEAKAADAEKFIKGLMIS
jgi:predicted transcriptional regulator